MDTKQTCAALTSNPGLGDDTHNQLAVPVPACGKAAAVSLYCYGILSLERVAAMFARHSEWRSA